ncbi:hypothetical protein EHQ61_12720 [Leptospira wolffii]|uniref:hypothetical protein n=1 Tax=Leptospira wolffii TaxID=409998 RepID=UPI0010842A64|nr:hypothetical protein [Leptospira wolffii]TGL49315.1 hypothetical protein EHQ61_12720 [Leptospira wolffii]
MTRIMYWNVSDFGNNRFFSASNQRDRSAPRPLTHQQTAAARLGILTNAILALNPDIFVLLECRFGNGVGAAAEGSAATDNSAATLLLWLRANVDPNFQLVPPIKLGTGARPECVAVFYKGVIAAAAAPVPALNRFFAGPYYWPGGAVGPAQNLPPAAGGAAPAYAAPWNLSLPNRQIDAASPILAGVWEDQLAGKFEYLGAVPPLAVAPAALLTFPNAGDRPPLQTDFIEMMPPAAPGGAVRFRVISLFSYHAPSAQNGPGGPANADSVLGTASVANIQELQNLPANFDAAVLVGDFNVSLFAAPAVIAAAYNPLQGLANMQQALAPGAGLNDTVKGYFKTHYGREPAPGTPNGARTWNAWDPTSVPGAPAVAGYPGYQYFGIRDNIGLYDAIDNIFVRPNPPAIANVTVANPVVGSPYTPFAGFAPPAGAPAQGNINFPRDPVFAPATFPLPVAGGGGAGPTPGGIDWTGGAAGGFNIAAQTTFRSWARIGRIRSTSDHLALVVEI